MSWSSVIGALAVRADLPVVGLVLWTLVGTFSCSPAGETRELAAERIEIVESAPLDPDSVTVLSWNIKGSAFGSDHHHLEEIASTIEELSPDIVMLQEVHRGTRASGELDQFEILSKALEMNGCFGESLAIGESGSYGNAVLTSGSIERSRRYILPGRGEPRTVLSCEGEWDGISVPVMTTHLTAWDRANRRTRALQTSAILELIESESSPLLLLGGDFNAALSSVEMAGLASSPRVRPVITDYVVTHPGSGRSYDHLFVGDGWSVEDARVVRQGPSDHWPILATLKMGSDGETR